MKKFSFVIPTYNRKAMLKNTLEALNNQAGYNSSDYEVIVVDDGSDDGTWDYIKGINRNYELQYIYLKREPCSCRARARNFGWKSAQGEIIVFIDADIIVKESHLLELNRLYSYKKNLVVLGTRLMLPRGAVMDFNNLFQIYNFNRKKITLMDTSYFVYDALSYNVSLIRTPGVLFSTCNSAVPRECLKAVKGFDENYIGWGFEDMDLGLRLYDLKDVKFAVSSKLEGLHQFHKNSPNLMEELKNNTIYFEKKFPYAGKNLPMLGEVEIWRVLEIPRDEYLKRFTGGQPGKRNKVVLEFKNKEWFDQLKLNILILSVQEGLDVEVYDYVEDTDLDIWIQLLEPGKSTIKYFPVSRRIGELSSKEISKYMLNLREAW